MFPVESLPAHYYEEREAAEAAKKLAQIQAQQAQAQQQTASCSSTLHATPQNGTQRPATTVFGSIFQGFVRQASQSPPPSVGKDSQCASGASTPVSAPPAKIMTQAAVVEAIMAKKMRDADIVGFRAW